MANTNYSSWLGVANIYGVGGAVGSVAPIDDKEAFVDMFGQESYALLTTLSNQGPEQWMTPAEYGAATDNDLTFLNENPYVGAVYALAEDKQWSTQQLNQALIAVGGIDLYKKVAIYQNNRLNPPPSGGGISNEQREANYIASISDTANKFGLVISDENIESLASEAISNNYNDVLLVDRMFEVADSSGLIPGDIEGNALFIVSQAYDYGVTMSLDEATALSSRVAQGELTDAGISAELAAMGREANPELITVINAGVSVNDFNSRTNEIRTLATSLGGSLSDEAISNMALNSLTSNFDTSQITRAVTTAIGSTDFAAGDILGVSLGIVQTAEANNVTISQDVANELAIKFINGDISETGINSFITETGIQQNPQYQALYELGYNTDAFESQKAIIATAASNYGIQLADDSVGKIAMAALRGDYNDTQINNAILDMADTTAVEVGAGSLMAKAEALQSQASNYLFSLSDATALKYARDIARGTLDESSLNSVFANATGARYEFLRPAFDAGLNANDYFSSQIETLANTLELGSDQISLSNPKIMEYLIDESGDQPKARSTSAALRMARGSQDWLKTDNAKSSMSTVAKVLGDVFGRSGL
jgi:hypothetical protein